MSQITLSSSNKTIVFEFGIDNGFGTETLSTKMPFQFFCSGETIITNLDTQVNLLTTSMYNGLWSDNFLMGLAGIVCASLLSFVFVKYAV